MCFSGSFLNHYEDLPDNYTDFTDLQKSDLPAKLFAGCEYCYNALIHDGEKEEEKRR